MFDGVPWPELVSPGLSEWSDFHLIWLFVSGWGVKHLMLMVTATGKLELRLVLSYGRMRTWTLHTSVSLKGFIQGMKQIKLIKKVHIQPLNKSSSPHRQ